MKSFIETAELPSILVTAVGALPHTEPAAAVDLIVNSLHSAPHPPQLARSDPREQMWIQFTEGLPGFDVDLENLNYHFDTAATEIKDLEEFYNRYLAICEGEAANSFAVGPEYGRGIHFFLERIQQAPERPEFIKLQVTGPLSFALTVSDIGTRPIFYDETFRDVAVKGIGLKAVWLIEQFKPYANNIIVFFDEPSLSAYGSSAFLGVSKEDVVGTLNEVISMASERGSIAGVHCCGNTDWGLLMETSTRIINFDAVDYMETLPIYASDLSRFLERGGVLAWGAVSNTEKVMEESFDDVLTRLRDGIRQVVDAGVDRDLLTERMIITPACGCAGLSIEQAEKVYHLLSELEDVDIADLA
jgi:hypothetical protein